jgi:hypothetical protein
MNSPRSVPDADFYHVAAYLSDLVKPWHPGDPYAARGLSHRWSHELEHKGGSAILKAMAGLDRAGRPKSVLEGLAR